MKKTILIACMCAGLALASCGGRGDNDAADSTVLNASGTGSDDDSILDVPQTGTDTVGTAGDSLNKDTVQ